jgi:hypothetical protein
MNFEHAPAAARGRSLNQDNGQCPQLRGEGLQTIAPPTPGRSRKYL